MIAADCTLRSFFGGGENAGGLWPCFFFGFFCLCLVSRLL